MIIFALFFLSITSIFSQTPDELFEKAFGQKPPTITYPLTIDLLVDDTYKGNLNIKFNPYTHIIHIPTTPLWDYVKANMNDSAYKDYSKYNSDIYILSSDLEIIGYKIKFDQKNQRLSIFTPVIHRKRIELSLNQHYFKHSNGPIRTSKHSGYINIKGDYRHETQTNTDEIDDSNDTNINNFTVNLEGVFNFNNKFTIESEADISVTDQPYIYLDGLRYIHDTSSQFKTLYIGDIQSQQLGSSLSSSHILGVALVKSFQEFDVQFPTSKFYKNFTVNSPAKVYSYMNGTLIDERKLSEGQYTFTDFPLANGKNTYELLIEPINKTPTRSYLETFLYDTSLIAPGESEYIYYSGVPMTLGESLSIENTLTLGLLQKKGMSTYQNYTKGIIANKDMISLTNGYSFVSNLGYFELNYQNTLFSNTTYFQTFTFLNRGFQHYLKKGGYYRGETRLIYTEPTSVLIDTDTKLSDRSLSIQLNENLTTKTINLVGRLTLTHFIKSMKNKLALRLSSYSKTPLYFMEKTIEFSQNTLLQTEFLWYIKTTFVTKKSRNLLTVSSKEGNIDSVYSMYYHPNNQNAISGFSQVAVSDQDNYSIQNQFSFHKLTGSYTYNHIDTPVFRGSTYYRGNRGDIKHIVNYSNSETEHSYQFDTAFVYADGHMGIGRHVNDSFVLLYAPENISYKYIEFNTKDKIDRFGPAVISNINVNKKYTLSVMDSQLKEGDFLQTPSVQVTPQKRQGIAISLSSEGIYMIKGFFVNSDNEPLDYIFGEFISKKDQSIRKPFFTNTKGRFILSGMDAGLYRIEFKGNLTPMDIEIKKSTSTIISLGTLIAHE